MFWSRGRSGGHKFLDPERTRRVRFRSNFARFPGYQLGAPPQLQVSMVYRQSLCHKPHQPLRQARLATEAHAIGCGSSFHHCHFAALSSPPFLSSLGQGSPRQRRFLRKSSACRQIKHRCRFSGDSTSSSWPPTTNRPCGSSTVAAVLHLYKWQTGHRTVRREYPLPYKRLSLSTVRPKEEWLGRYDMG